MKFSRIAATAALATSVQSVAVTTDDTTFRFNELTKLANNNIVNMRQVTRGDLFVNMPRVFDNYRNMISLLQPKDASNSVNAKRDCVFNGDTQFCDSFDNLDGELFPKRQLLAGLGGVEPGSEGADPFAQLDADHDDDVNDVRDDLADDIADDSQQDGGLTKRQSETADPFAQLDADHDDDVNDVRDDLADDIADDSQQDGGLTKRQSETADPFAQLDADHDDDVNDVRDDLADDIADDSQQDGGLTKRQAKVLAADVQESICNAMSKFLFTQTLMTTLTNSKTAAITNSPLAQPFSDLLQLFDSSVDLAIKKVVTRVPSCRDDILTQTGVVTEDIAATREALKTPAFP